MVLDGKVDRVDEIPKTVPCFGDVWVVLQGELGLGMKIQFP